MATIYSEFAISLNVRKNNTSLPAIRVETALNGLPHFSSEYPRGRVWQSAVWPDALREVQHVSVTIELGCQCATRDRIAMNHTFAGLINYLDAASRVESMRIQLLDAHHYKTAELLEVIQPAAILVRCRPEVATKLVDISAELIDAAVQARRSHSRSDNTIEEFYSRVRMAARAAGRLHQAALHSRIEKLNHDMAEIMAEVGSVGPGIREKVEVAIGKLDAVLACLMDGL
ncbi:hypothetical protein MBLNU13_g06683t1 [Cladosporium sp. NU13]